MFLQNKVANVEDLPLVSIVILNYNKTLLTRELLISLRRITYPEPQANAMSRCNYDQRTNGRCQLRTAVCADGQ